MCYSYDKQEKSLIPYGEHTFSCPRCDSTIETIKIFSPARDMGDDRDWFIWLLSVWNQHSQQPTLRLTEHPAIVKALLVPSPEHPSCVWTRKC
ncbi:hypothetical protein MTR_4g020900 [Medicago truncatula]|uniref:Uncharacterized protein n=2 Tax=Medicago truncatula TaxID=3880 RepID=A0A072UGY5_MEDTR|nr:hypothetical protein MTR_4g020900 [Medicago truncatula]